jgi:hypothetical protein
LKKRRLSITEKTPLLLSILSFMAYLFFTYFNSILQFPPLTNELLTLAFLFGILQHYVFTLIIIMKSDAVFLRKTIAFVAVIVSGHFGSWIYYIFFHSKVSGKVPETDRIEMLPFISQAEKDLKKETG